MVILCKVSCNEKLICSFNGKGVFETYQISMKDLFCKKMFFSCSLSIPIGNIKKVSDVFRGYRKGNNDLKGVKWYIRPEANIHGGS